MRLQYLRSRLRDRAVLPARFLAPVSLCLLLASCGGGGGGGSSPYDPPPAISNLSFAPSALYQSSGGTGTISGSIDFTDPDGDLATIHITPSGGTAQTASLAGAAGKTSGTITGVVMVSTATAGNFTFDVWLTDSKGASSNHLSGTFDVVPNLGLAWTPRTSPTGADLRRVAWSGSLFVAVGAGGTILTSPDGVAWTTAPSGTTNALNGVTWTGTRFVAVGDAGTVLTSPTGLTWASWATGRTDIALAAVADSGSALVVVGGQGAGTNGTGSASLILASNDGVTWTERATGLADWVFTGIAWSGTHFVAAGQSYAGGTSGDVIWSSTDGTTWSQQTVNSSNSALYDLVWSGSKFVAVGHGYALVSSDGSLWQVIAQSAGNNTSFGLFASGVAGSGQQYLAVGDMFSQIETSLDAISWTESVSPTTLGTLYGVGWGNGEFVAVGAGGHIFTSP